MKMLYTLIIVAVIVSPVLMNAGEIKRIGGDSASLRLYRQTIARQSQAPPRAVKAVKERKAVEVKATQASTKVKADGELTVKTLTNKYVAYLEGMTGLKLDTVTIDVRRMLNSDGGFDISSRVIVSDGETVKSY